jgi:hypothetical protein
MTGTKPKTRRMRSSRRSYIAVFVLVSPLFAVTAANADTAAALVEKGRLLGRWAQDCSKPPAYNNLHQTYEALNDGSVRAAVYSGEYVDSNTNETSDHKIALIEHIDIPTPTKISMQLLDSLRPTTERLFATRSLSKSRTTA